MWELEVIVFSLTVCASSSSLDGLHVEAARVHGPSSDVALTLLASLRYLDVERARFVFVKEVVELVVRCAVYRRLIVGHHTLRMTQDALVVSEVGR